MENLMNGLYTYVTDFQPFVYILIAIALLIVGVMFIVPSEKTKEMAKGAIPWIVIGAGNDEWLAGIFAGTGSIIWHLHCNCCGGSTDTL